MEKKIEIVLPKKFQNKKIVFGIPDNKKELDKMFNIRTQVYIHEKKYITGKNVDIDIHDINKTCTYLIAMVEDKVVGTIRIIEEEILPIQKDYFYFETPKELRNFKNNQIVEIGRIISRPYKVLGYFLPRGLIMLGLFFAGTLYGKANNKMAGYGAIKLYAYKKFKKLHIPIKLIKNYTLKYNPQNSLDPLNNFFKKDDPVIPVYFLVEDLIEYFDFMFNKSGLFYKKDDSIYILSEIWQIKFLLTKLKIYFKNYKVYQRI